MKYFEKMPVYEVDIVSIENVISNLEKIRWFINPHKSGDGSIAVVFNGQYYGVYSNHAGILNWGTYTVEDGIVYTTMLGGHQVNLIMNDSIFTKTEEKLILKIDISDYYYPVKLILDSSKVPLYYTGIVAPVGHEYFLDGVKVLKLDEKMMYVQENLKVRNTPSLQAKVYSVLTKTTPVYIYARTINKEIIDDKEDYWYYVNWTITEYPSYGWMFGGYLKDNPPFINMM